VHHHEVVDVDVKHRLNVLAGHFVVPLNRECTGCGNHETNVQIFHLLCEVVVVIRGQGLFAGEVDLDDAGLGHGIKILNICVNCGEFLSVARDEHYVESRRDLTRIFCTHTVGGSGNEHPGSLCLVLGWIFSLKLVERGEGVFHDETQDFSKDQQ